MPALIPVSARGTPREIGRAMGRFGADAMARLIRPSAYWARTVAQAGSDRVRAMEAATRAALPAIMAEIEGVAEGLDLPFDQVFAWMCRGDLRSDLPEGCTTVMVPGAPRVIAHNEDGGPEELLDCGLLQATPADGPAFAAFLYPGSIPGSAFGVNAAGLVATVNNVRAAHAPPGVPRMVVGRAMLGCRTLDAAVALIRALPRAGGFHFAMAQAGDARLLSVEFTGDRVSVVEVAEPTAHANHLIHPGMADTPQRITQSSGDRQARAGALLGAAPLAILQDEAGPGLPILRRDPHDPDEENTVVSLVATIGDTVAAAIHDPGAAEPYLTLTVRDGAITAA
ncbi:MAG: peptidase C45 [Rhodobacteraceae bacterium]|nr:peptidase C45 [Paracoccaceae bacterium]